MNLILSKRRRCDGCGHDRECVRANLLGVIVYLCVECEAEQGPMESSFVERGKR